MLELPEYVRELELLLVEYVEPAERVLLALRLVLYVAELPAVRVVAEPELVRLPVFTVLALRLPVLALALREPALALRVTAVLPAAVRVVAEPEAVRVLPVLRAAAVFELP